MLTRQYFTNIEELTCPKRTFTQTQKFIIVILPISNNQNCTLYLDNNLEERIPTHSSKSFLREPFHDLVIIIFDSF